MSQQFCLLEKSKANKMVDDDDEDDSEDDEDLEEDIPLATEDNDISNKNKVRNLSMLKM
jgi:hypothetical protein